MPNSRLPGFSRLALVLLLGLAAAAPAEEPKKSTPPRPALEAAPGYHAILPGKLLLAAKASPPMDAAKTRWQWTQKSGPAPATIERPTAPVSWAVATAPGAYVFEVAASDGTRNLTETVKSMVYPAGPRFGNPILPGMFPDPHILHHEGMFYIFATSMENDAGAYGRASVWSSVDFVNWEMKLTNWPVYGEFGGDIWAPDAIRKGDRFYQFVTRSGRYDTMLGVADHPLGPWKSLREDGSPIVSGGPPAGRVVPAYNMDAQPFIDDDGKAYMYWGWAESMAARLTPDLKDIDGPVIFLKGTKWLPDGGTLPQWLSVDLGESLPITKATVSPEFRHVPYGYRIEASEDNEHWSLLIDRTGNTTEVAGTGYTHELKGRGRHVRITFTSCGGHWAGLYDFSVYSGDRKVSLGKPATASATRGRGSEPANAVDPSNGPQLDDFVEGSYMIKHRGKYYLLYSSGVLHDGSYSVHYAMGDDPLGPFVKPNPNIVIRRNAEGTTKGPGHNSVLKLGDQHYIVYHQHNQPHEDAGGVFRQTAADRMNFRADGTIEEVVPTQTGVGALGPMPALPADLAAGCYATATSTRTAAYQAEHAFDRNFASKWRAADNTYPQSLTVDLGGIRDISGIETSFEYPTLSYRYRLETSTDGKSWQAFADRSAAFATATSPWRDAGEARAAFVRLTIEACERPENGAGVYSLVVRGKP